MLSMYFVFLFIDPVLGHEQSLAVLDPYCRLFDLCDNTRSVARREMKRLAMKGEVILKGIQLS